MYNARITLMWIVAVHTKWHIRTKFINKRLILKASPEEEEEPKTTPYNQINSPAAYHLASIVALGAH